MPLGNERAAVRPDLLTCLLHRLPAEMAHDLTLSGLHRVSRLLPPVRLPSSIDLAATHMSLRFAHPVCLAAGFDKTGRATQGLQRFGFAGMEVGSVTQEPQPGNPKPRLFRLPEIAGLINRMGFNSEGLAKAKLYLADRNRSLIVGVNLGLNKGLQDYGSQFRALTRELAPHADYVTINLSSPNTPGLRSLLDPDHVAPLLDAVRRGFEDAEIHRSLVLKLSPDMDRQREADLLACLAEARIDGVIAGNTTVDRAMLSEDAPHRDEVGGLSGLPLARRARDLLDRVVATMPADITVIASGGIASGRDAYERLSAGAHLIQIYTAFVYSGRSTVPRLLSELRQCMAQDNVRHVADLWGLRHP